MAESNTENIVENNEEQLESLKPTLLYTIIDENYNEELQYPNEKLGIWKSKLEIVRSGVDSKFKKSLSPLRRPKNNAPLHEVYKNIINKDSFSSLAMVLANKNNVYSKYSKWQVKVYVTLLFIHT